MHLQLSRWERWSGETPVWTQQVDTKQERLEGWLKSTPSLAFTPYTCGFVAFQVKEVEWDDQCGSNNLDALLAQHFATAFATKHKLKAADVLGNPRTMAKMRKQVRV
jgi:hypothetical protein